MEQCVQVESFVMLTSSSHILKTFSRVGLPVTLRSRPPSLKIMREPQSGTTVAKEDLGVNGSLGQRVGLVASTFRSCSSLRKAGQYDQQGTDT